jgi:hypothetical protein
VLEDEPGHDAIALEREIATSEGELAAGNVPALGELVLEMLQRGEHEQIRALIETRLPHANAVHDPVAKRQLGHRQPSLEVQYANGGADAPRRRQKMQTARADHNSLAHRRDGRKDLDRATPVRGPRRLGYHHVPPAPASTATTPALTTALAAIVSIRRPNEWRAILSLLP